MTTYDSKLNMEMRIMSLDSCGHDSSVWSFAINPPKKGHVIEIVSPDYVSRQCWEKVFENADHIATIILPFRKLIDVFPGFTRYGSEIEKRPVHQFYFYNETVAKQMALLVQKSARNVRKNKTRNSSIKKAGGFYSKEIIEKIFIIQKGACYYSGAPLVKTPKNYVIDHIHPICQGGTNWPVNLALVIKEINTWKGGHISSEQTLIWLSKSRSKSWLHKQKQYCAEVDEKRELLDVEFRKHHEVS